MAENKDPTTQSFTKFLNTELSGGDNARSGHYNKLYTELRRIAIARRVQWNGDQTVGVTALVNETYLKLFSKSQKEWGSRKEFFSYASKAMRHVLINYSRDRCAAKRGGNKVHDSEADHELVSPDYCERLLDIDSALDQLAKDHPRFVTIVEMKVFGKFTVEEIADFLEVGTATVKRDWKVARARLYQILKPEEVTL